MVSVRQFRSNSVKRHCRGCGEIRNWLWAEVEDTSTQGGSFSEELRHRARIVHRGMAVELHYQESQLFCATAVVAVMCRCWCGSFTADIRRFLLLLLCRLHCYISCVVHASRSCWCWAHGHRYLRIHSNMFYRGTMVGSGTWL